MEQGIGSLFVKKLTHKKGHPFGMAYYGLAMGY
jgi:hypothetical protein